MIDIIGRTLGRYHIIEPLGEGGMAAVYKAFDTNLERDVAVKIIRTEKGSDATFLKRFRREAKALAYLDHPYILKVLDYGEQDGIPFLVMPFIPGGTLKKKMGVAVPYQEACSLLAPIARALEYAHREGFIHRDIKPANILITKTGDPILSDFGIAKILDSKDSQQLTMTGEGIGTPDYMAPEQWMGDSDARSDIYALGIVFYELVTGRRPYMADTPAAVFLKHRQDPLPRPTSFVPGIPEVVEGVLYKCLAKEPDDRYQTMSDFALALENLAHQKFDQLEPSTVDLNTETWVAQKPASTIPTIEHEKDKQKKGGLNKGLVIAASLIVIASIVLCIVLGGGGFYLFSHGKASDTDIAVEQGAGIAEETSVQATGEPAVTEEAAVIEIPAQIEISPDELEETPPAYFSPTTEPFDTIEGLRDDVPVLKDNNGDLILSESSGVVSYNFSTNLSVEEAAEFYENGMEEEDWEQVNTTYAQADDMISYSYTKNHEQGMDSVTISVYTAVGRTYIMITVIEIEY